MSESAASDIVEFGFQIDATQGETAVNVAALDHVIAPVLGEIGNGFSIPPSHRRMAVRFRQEPPSPRQQPGQQLWDVFVGVRQRGDAIVLGEEVLYAVERAGVRFEQMAQIVLTNGCQEAAF
ncbi:hypothetical protein GXW84_35045 [Rhodococcus sp. IEGM 248]|uniref:hypothetical protein n=1 Tax=Rhodococcus opacus TaxID=37919 RepID=UPI0013C135C5|nr:hypothetical protein [Rhodococcus opacus]MDV7088350.1 hypothetical protein [Rhodococcus opacus]NDV09617.1 hypothetical protein [Rhodococcus sp. IEGM 248]